MATDIETIVEETRHYADEARRQLPVDMVYLFGSYAKGGADKGSDVDVAFFLQDYGGKTRFDIGVELLKLCRNYKAYFEPLVFETSEIDRNNPFVNEILRTGLKI
jgi:predicted nucleotidyltransferase